MYTPKVDEIIRRRTNQGLTRAGLSLKAGMAANAIARIEEGITNSTHQLCAKAIAAALGCKVTDIFANGKESTKMKKTYTCEISSNNTNLRTYEVTTRSAYKAAQMYGYAEGGEKVEIYDGDKLISAARWDIEIRKYYRCTI